jgi:hypothetical protein
MPTSIAMTNTSAAGTQAQGDEGGARTISDKAPSDAEQGGADEKLSIKGPVRWSVERSGEKRGSAPSAECEP